MSARKFSTFFFLLAPAILATPLANAQSPKSALAQTRS
jgi:hypothetical protein